MTVTNPPVVFSFPMFTATFPEFSQLTPIQGQAYFNQATLICGNQCSNPMYGDGVLEPALYVLTAHFAWLLCPKDPNGNPAATGIVASQLVGRIGSASEGSISAGAEYATWDQNTISAFLNQTKYGAQYAAVTSQYRTARYVARPTRVINGTYPALFGPVGTPLIIRN